MRNVLGGLFLAAMLPFVVGFGDLSPDQNTAQTIDNTTILFPQGQIFYPPMANPKEPRTHVTYLRLNLADESINTGSVGFGDSFGLIRLPGMGEKDAWQLGISGAVLAQFNLDADSMDLVNADYIIGFPLSYRNGFWSAAGAHLPSVLPPGGRISPPATESGAEGNAHKFKLRDR